MADLETPYRNYVDSLQDSIAHKIFILESDACFKEWVEEHYPERMDEL